MPRIIAACLATSLLAVVPGAVFAQDTSPPAAAPSFTPATAHPEPQDSEAERRRSEARTDRRAMFEARLAALRAGLLLTPEQDRLWPPVETAIRDFVALRATAADKRSDERQDAEDDDEIVGGDDPVAALKDYGDGLLERGRALKAVADAAAPLWAFMSDEQKHRLPKLLHEMNPRHGGMREGDARDDREGMPGEGGSRRHADDQDGRWDRDGGWDEREGRHHRGAERAWGRHADAPHDPMDDEASDDRW